MISITVNNGTSDSIININDTLTPEVLVNAIETQLTFLGLPQNTLKEYYQEELMSDISQEHNNTEPDMNELIEALCRGKGIDRWLFDDIRNSWESSNLSFDEWFQENKHYWMYPNYILSEEDIISIAKNW